MQNIIEFIKSSLSGYYPLQEITSFTRIIVEHTTGLSLPTFLIDKSKKITPEQEENILRIIERLKQYEPLQYILSETEFYGMKFTVDKNVLIPRPETEELVELILNENINRPSPSILDIGTGSGAIAISLKKYLPNSYVEAWDISAKALKVASDNAKSNGTDVLFKEVDVLNDYPRNKSFDIIVSNPPYVLESEKASIENNVLNYEPHLALFVPDHKALLFYERIAEISKEILQPEGILYFEINTMKGQETIDMLAKKGFRNISLNKDLSGKDRMIKCIY